MAYVLPLNLVKLILKKKEYSLEQVEQVASVHSLAIRKEKGEVMGEMKRLVIESTQDQNKNIWPVQH